MFYWNSRNALLFKRLLFVVILADVKAFRQQPSADFEKDVITEIDGSSLLATRGDLLKEHSLVKPYEGSAWLMAGFALISNQFVRLTPDHPDRMGAVADVMPFNYRSWEVELTLKIYSPDLHKPGDGMAFWYVNEIDRQGRAFGFPDLFRGLGLFIDTKKHDFTDANHKHPFISATVNNGSMQYVHDALGTHLQLGGENGGCYASLYGDQYDPSKILIRYAERTLSVFVAEPGESNWKLCMESEGVILPRGYHFAVSASTGMKTSEIHEIISIRVFALESVSSEQDFEDERNVIFADQMAPERVYAGVFKKEFDFFGTILIFLLPIVVIALILTFIFVRVADSVSVRSKRLF
ncbi:unnamed protein product [Anisakis simplex]|uniref:L-type lectin-like domain-containing protein n=1 Tax=Anisakis simplex TaxID=6269 RepID=A0A0M3K3N1_ANISI|nr:unnamed protein product [Anisakis simplex]